MTGGTLSAADAVDAMIAGPHGPIPVRRYSPPPGTATLGSAPIVWVHGGAFMFGDLDLPESHEVARALAGAGFSVIAVDYRRASIPGLRRPPDTTAPAGRFRFPVPVDDVLAVVRAVQRAQPAHGGRVILGGASAGACLAAAAALRLAAEGAPPLGGVFFAYGVFHARLPRRTRATRIRPRGRRRFTHTPLLLDLMNRNYAGGRSELTQPHAFPGGHPLPGFPPALLIDAENDAMRASGEQFARELAAAQLSVEYHLLPDAAHAFFNRPRTPDFAAGIRLIVAWANLLPGDRSVSA